MLRCARRAQLFARLEAPFDATREMAAGMGIKHHKRNYGGTHVAMSYITVVSCERQNVVRRRCERTSYKLRAVCSATQGRSYLELYTRPRPISLARGQNIIYLGCLRVSL